MVRGPVLVVLCILCCACAWAIPRSASDSHVNGFWLAQNQKGRETVALVTSKNQHVKCTFNYDTFPFSQPKDEKKEQEEMPPSQILASYMRSNPCLSFKNDHGYHLCIGKNATQEVDGNRATPPLLLGVFKGWTSMGEQTYDEGSKDHCTISRTFTVQFTCDKTLKVVSVSEPSVCKYHFIVGAPEACGHRVFERQLSATGAGVETWYMEVFEARDEAISCVVHAAGFGLPSPTHSDTITDFSLKLEMGNTILDIASFDARHGLRAPFEEADLQASDEGLKPLTLPLPASPNYLAITANTA